MAPLEGETILLDPQDNKFCLLNQTAAFLWNRLEEPVTEDQLAEQILSKFEGVTQDDALRDVREMLVQLTAMNLVAAEPAAEG